MSKRGTYPPLDDGFKVRREACRLAAQVMAGRPDEELAPRLWSVTVFFECYMTKGARGTMKDFGPKEPVKLKMVKKEKEPSNV